MRELRRTLDELCLRYELEDKIKDIYVEGVYDKDIIEWYLKEVDVSDVSVYEISSVDIPSIMLEKVNRNDGNKARIVALANELEIRIKKNSFVLCVADQDLDPFVDMKENRVFLAYTDYICMEAYFFERDTVDRMFSLFFGKKIENIDAIMGNIVDVVCSLFSVRIAKFKLCPDVPMISIEKCCSWTDGKIMFDADDYCKRMLIANGKGNIIEDFISLQKQINHEIQSIYGCFNGHDLFSVLDFICKRIFKRSGDNIDRLLISCFKFSSLASHTLFSRMEMRV